VNTVERSRSPPNNSIHMESQSKYIKIKMSDLKSLKITRKTDQLTLLDGRGDIICNFVFQHGSCTTLVDVLKGIVKLAPARRHRNVFVVVDESPNDNVAKSFRDLNLFDEPQPTNTIWDFMKGLQTRPYEATMESFGKIAEIVTAPYEDIDDETKKILEESITALGYLPNKPQEEYEVIPGASSLPERKDYPRGSPLTIDQWNNLQDVEGKLEDVEYTKLHIFRGGVSPNIRKQVWPYLLDYYPWNSTRAQREALVRTKRDEYHVMKLQWKTMTKIQEDNFADYSQRKSLIEKDVNRTDRCFEFYAGDNNANLQTLNDILMTYVMYNFDAGYVQGMSDLLSPILYVLKDEVDSFWCFVGFMNRIGANFERDQLEMKEQFQNLYTLINFLDSDLGKHFQQYDSSHMFVCFRWLLVWFKRELNMDDTLRLWEVLWTTLPCQNFHLLVGAAILLNERDALISNACDVTEILRHINDLAGKLEISAILNFAEGIYNQLIETQNLPDSIRVIIGLPTTGNNANEVISNVDSIEASSLDPDVDELCDAGLLHSHF